MSYGLRPFSPVRVLAPVVGVIAFASMPATAAASVTSYSGVSCDYPLTGASDNTLSVTLESGLIGFKLVENERVVDGNGDRLAEQFLKLFRIATVDGRMDVDLEITSPDGAVTSRSYELPLSRFTLRADVLNEVTYTAGTALPEAVTGGKVAVKQVKYWLLLRKADGSIAYSAVDSAYGSNPRPDADFYYENLPVPCTLPARAATPIAVQDGQPATPAPTPTPTPAATPTPTPTPAPFDPAALAPRTCAFPLLGPFAAAGAARIAPIVGSRVSGSSLAIDLDPQVVASLRDAGTFRLTGAVESDIGVAQPNGAEGRFPTSADFATTLPSAGGQTPLAIEVALPGLILQQGTTILKLYGFDLTGLRAFDSNGNLIRQFPDAFIYPNESGDTDLHDTFDAPCTRPSEPDVLATFTLNTTPKPITPPPTTVPGTPRPLTPTPTPTPTPPPPTLTPTPTPTPPPPTLTPTPTPPPPTLTPTPRPMAKAVQFVYPVTGNTTLKTLTKGSVPLTGTLLSVFRPPLAPTMDIGTLELPPATGKLVAFGFLPATAKLAFTTQGQVTGTLAPGSEALRVKARLALPSITLFGLQLSSGTGCQAKNVIDLAFSSTDFVRTSGGTLRATYAISDLVNCGALNGVLSSATAGNGNAMALKLGVPDSRYSDF